MKVFISWSGNRSYRCAELFSEWLPQVIQAVEPLVSTDFEKGLKWPPELYKTLDISKVGIICLTRENLNNKWILFEAGALSKIPETRVCTFLLDLTPIDIELPLSQFMHTVFEKEDVYKLLLTINSQVEKGEGKSLPEKTLKSVFEVFWPSFKQKIHEIQLEPEISKTQIRTDREILEEILELIRQSDRRNRLSFGTQVDRIPYNIQIEAIKEYIQSIKSGIPERDAIKSIIKNVDIKYQMSEYSLIELNNFLVIISDILTSI